MKNITRYSLLNFPYYFENSIDPERKQKYKWWYKKEFFWNIKKEHKDWILVIESEKIKKITNY